MWEKTEEASIFAGQFTQCWKNCIDSPDKAIANVKLYPDDKGASLSLTFCDQHHYAAFLSKLSVGCYYHLEAARKSLSVDIRFNLGNLKHAEYETNLLVFVLKELQGLENTLPRDDIYKAAFQHIQHAVVKMVSDQAFNMFAAPVLRAPKPVKMIDFNQIASLK